MRSKILRIVEWSLLVIGVAGLSIYGAAHVSARMTQAHAARSLEMATKAAAGQPAAGTPLNLPLATPRCPSGLEPCSPGAGDAANWRTEMIKVPTPDMSDWAQGRRECHARSIAQLDPATALGRLDIPSVRVSVIVLPGIDAMCLNGGVGHIPGTPAPGEPGNIGIAGHRDGFFRGLEHIAKGAVLRLTTPRGAFEYQVQWTKVVEPKDVEVLAGTGADEITLVTCYPFRVLGSAPKRFIVRASCTGKS